MALVLEIDHLLGIAFAAQGQDRAAPDWPPQPDRVFSALVAAWAARGQRPGERAALQWLEAQPAPRIEATSFTARPAPSTFVPPNDKATLPDRRSRQPRQFPAALPHDPVMRLVWPGAEDAPVAALDAVAADVAYVGHSASLTRCRFIARAEDPAAEAQAPTRRVYAGRLQELLTAFEAGRRPEPGDVVPPAARAEPATNPHSNDWLVLSLEAGALDLRAAPVAAKTLRDTVMSGFGQAGLPVPEWVSGHQPDGAPSRLPHLAVVPLAFVGFDHADGRLMGLALVPPHGLDLLQHEGFRAAMRCVSTVDESGRRLIALRLGGGVALTLAAVLEAEHASLDPARYMRPSRRWATATPLVLDRHLKGATEADRAAEAVRLVEDACVRAIGHRPAVQLSKHAAIDGAPSAAPSGHAPRWTAWRLPDSMRSRRLTHATLTFSVDVPGPLLIGAGRHIGLGLCLPVDA